MRPTVLIPLALAIATLSAPIVAQESSDNEDVQLTEIIQQVEANEALYRNLETTLLRLTDQADIEKGDGILLPHMEETIHTVRQGELIRYEGEEMQIRPTGDQVVRKRLSTYDGDRSVSIEYGNSVNIHLDCRYEASQVVPPHCCAADVWGLNFPLSVLLRGTDAIHAHPKFRSNPVEMGTVYEFAKVKCRFEGIEEVDGMQCVKIRCDRLRRSTGNPEITYLWLATDRNYLCVQSASASGLSESIVEELRQIAPGVWLPERVLSKRYTLSPTGHRYVVQQVTHVVEKSDPAPAYPVAFFHQTELPDDVPLFTIEKGILQGSPLRWDAHRSSDERLSEIVEEIDRNEQLYSQIEVATTENYWQQSEGPFGPTFVSVMARKSVQRSVVMDANTYFSEEESTQLADDTSSVSTRFLAFDGHWTRRFHTRLSDDRTQRSASLQHGRSDVLGPFRPHTAILRTLREHLNLSDILRSVMGNNKVTQTSERRQTCEYLGGQVRDGLECDVIRRSTYYPRNEAPRLIDIVWLAKERNYIPIRKESYSRRDSDSLPSSVTVVDDLRQIAPGVWYPFHVITHRFEGFSSAGLAEGRLIVQWQREYTVTDVTREPKVANEIFTTISVPAGTNVSVSDADGELLGSYLQAEPGNLAICPEEFAAMKVHAQQSKLAQEERIAAMDAMVGRQAPDFPDGEWINSQPLSWNDLAGKVVVLDYWAHWCRPCRKDLEFLAENYRRLKESGIVVVGVHTAGSKQSDVEYAAAEKGLAYPIYIDTLSAESGGWGTLFQGFAVDQVPHAFLIDKTGKIHAHGDLQEVLAEAARLNGGQP